MREPRPFFRKQTRAWYVQFGKEQINLGKDREAAFEEYHELMAKRRDRKVKSSDGVVAVLDLYWEWLLQNRAPSTCDRRKPILKSLAKHLGAKFKVRQLKPYHIQEWITKRFPGANSTYRHTLITVAKHAMNWAVKMGYIDHSPIAQMEKPTPEIRQEFVPVDLWPRVLELATDQEFREFLTVMLSSGARPQEIFKIEAHHFKRSDKNIVFAIVDSKGKKRSRVIWLPQDAFQIVDRLAEEHREGKLFRNRKGKAWTRNSVKCRFRRLKKLLGMPKLCATTLRHSYAHHRLSSGQDSHIVSKLMGHVNGRMLETRYGHIEANPEFMQQQANQVVIPMPSVDEKAQGDAKSARKRPDSDNPLGRTA